MMGVNSFPNPTFDLVDNATRVCGLRNKPRLPANKHRWAHGSARQVSRSNEMIGRCDRCGARAKVEALLPSGHLLAFCQHHANQHSLTLLASGAILDGTRELTI